MGAFGPPFFIIGDYMRFIKFKTLVYKIDFKQKRLIGKWEVNNITGSKKRLFPEIPAAQPHKNIIKK